MTSSEAKIISYPPFFINGLIKLASDRLDVAWVKVCNDKNVPNEVRESLKVVSMNFNKPKFICNGIGTLLHENDNNEIVSQLMDYIYKHSFINDDYSVIEKYINIMLIEVRNDPQVLLPYFDV